MSEKTINFGDKKINKKDFYNNKKQFNIEDIDINKILISKPETYEHNMRKYIIGLTITLSAITIIFTKNDMLLSARKVLEKCLFLLLIMNF